MAILRVVIVCFILGTVWAADGDVSLVGGEDLNSGLVQIEFGGQQGTVCNDDWNIYAADVVCKQVRGTTSKATAHFAPPEGITLKVFLDDVECMGNELTLMDCVHGKLGESSGDAHSSAGVICWTPEGFEEHTNGIVRLSGGPSSTAGRVEAFVNGSWGSVCDRQWSVHDASVVCKQLGCFSESTASTGSKYGHGPLDFKLTDVNCVGTEESLIKCPNTVIKPDGNTTCTHAEEAGVECDCGISVTIGEGNDGSGLLEVTRAGGPEGTLCYDVFSLRSADVACRESGFLGAMSIAASENTTGVLLDVLYSCNGTEISLGACTEIPYLASQCTDGREAVVTCQKYDDTEPSAEPTTETPSSGLSTGAIVGIIIGVLTGIVLIIGIAFCFCKERKRGPASI